jgi:UDP-N-acetylglucosamine acyltransferase
MTAQIHPTAVIDATSVLADDVVVGPHAVVGAQVEIGPGTEIGAAAQVQGPTRIGAGNRVFPHACIGFEPQDLKFRGEDTRLEIGDRNVFRELCTIHRGTAKGGGVTRIADDNLFMAYSHVAHDCQVGSRTIFANGATLAGHVLVEDDAAISAFTSVHQFCRVGCHAYVGGYTVLTQDALPYVKTVGAKPACYGINRIGLERKGLSTEAIRRLDAAYRILVRSGKNLRDALATLEAEHSGHPEVDHLIAFAGSSERGVVRATPGQKGGRGGG